MDESLDLNQDNILDGENYDKDINIIMENISYFIDLFDKEINKTFIKEICYNETETQTQNETCEREKYKSDLYYSTYNFNIVN